MLLPRFCLNLQKIKAQKGNKPGFGNLVILSQGYSRTFRAIDKCIFLQSSKCITGYQMKDLLRVPLGLFFYETVCSVPKH